MHGAQNIVLPTWTSLNLILLKNLINLTKYTKFHSEVGSFALVIKMKLNYIIIIIRYNKVKDYSFDAFKL